MYPRQHLKDIGLTRGTYNQIANYVIAQSEINIAIDAKSPVTYFAELAEQCKGAAKKYGGITERDELLINLHTHCIPASMLNGEIKDFGAFLEERRKLMVLKIKTWFETL